MGLVLGIDAAWTETGSSGVALLECTKAGRRILACAPSYASFIGSCAGAPVEWTKPHHGAPNVADLFKATEHFGVVDVVAIDMPMARKKILKRRPADQMISVEFRNAWAGTHSPTALRPGEHGHRLTTAFVAAGYSLVTRQNQKATHSLIEVYPLAALVRLMNLEKRPPYKVARSRRYWPDSQLSERIDKLLNEWLMILTYLKSKISELAFDLPDRQNIANLSALKPYEDTLDAIICTFIGSLYLEGAAEAFGDAQAAIWVPKNRFQAIGSDNNYLAAVQETLSEWHSPSDAAASRNL